MNTPSAETNSPAPRTKYKKYVGWVMAIGVCATVAAVVYRVVVDVRHEEECRANLNRIGVALQNDEDRYGSFPPAYVLNEQGQRWHSWRVLLLPDLGYTDLYDQYRFDEAWNGPHNRQLLAEYHREAFPRHLHTCRGASLPRCDLAFARSGSRRDPNGPAAGE